MDAYRSLNSRMYGLRSKGGAHGDVYTSPCVVSYMLNLVGYTTDKDLSLVRILEPSCGEGEFLVEILRRLYASSVKYNFDFESVAYRCIVACDNDSDKIERCIERIVKLHLPIKNVYKIFINADFLTVEMGKFDVVVGNPPYIRYENIPTAKRLLYKKIYTTFYYRPDIYILFYEKSLGLLKRGGRHCFICSNRWLKNEYGKRLRRVIAQNFNIEQIINMEKTNPFTEAVLAYPSITLIKNESRTSNDRCTIREIESLEDLDKGETMIRYTDMPQNEDWSGVFATNMSDDLVSIESMGYFVGIGVATGADKIFVTHRFLGMIEDDLLLPALGARDLRNNKLCWSGKYLLNPYRKDGFLINLEEYPRAAAYLLENEEKLRNRHVAKRAPKNWYRPIDRIYPDLLHTPKILLPDISGNKYIIVDEGNYYPLHNLYYISGKSIQDLKALSAILMSDFIREQLSGLTNCMNGGYLRWQSQYIKKLRIPIVLLTNEYRKKELIAAYDNHDISKINNIIMESISCISNKRVVSFPKKFSFQIPIDYVFD